ncbi:hypothetical protein B0H67DRAFT_549669 [Lasiosphaeris hirsuta]|uniref:Uncharacterized protein n=1 Tax=Lasiosphaeris hirsuta TaxID=260670 RepID=A0AA40BD24_9PEZI|nr:hypothetical protein B0H67DRAFT_549669 [Lasiosphaeris hirsuta]
MLEALQSWRFSHWDWAAKKPNPSDPKAPTNYNVPIMLPYQGIEIKVPASLKAKAQAPSFTGGQVWPDLSPPEPGEHRQAVTNPFYQFTMPNGYEKMGDSKLGGIGNYRQGVEGERSSISLPADCSDSSLS